MKNDLDDELVADAERKQELLESAPEEERWNPIGGSSGQRVMPLYEDGEDEDGRPQGATLVEEGVSAAEFDQMLAADRSDPDQDEDSDPEVEQQTDEDQDEMDEEAARLPRP